MPFRDRTQEFRTTGASYQMKIQANVPKANLDGRQQLIKESIEFNQLSKRISRDLTSTCAKLEKLAELAKRKSLFEDKGNDIEELAKVVKQDITGLNKQIALLMEYGKQRVGSHNQSQDHSKLVVVGLQSKLANVSKTYQDVLGVRTENMKQIRNRAGMYSQTQQQRTNGPMLPNSSTKSLLLMDDERKHGVALDMDGLEQEQLQNQAMILDETEGYLRSRNTAMETIEKNIHEIGSIFSQLATLVAEQGDMITRIDSNVEQSSINIEGAHHELVKYFNTIARNRWLVFKVFFTICIAFMIFVVFLT
uniref:t-SNARE coiled-coil homology domain-containing protein n=1 Tax=Rhabditophanes sp. KR3021 TaxID=114890 RepID=A0AC35UBG3_9BILA